MFDLKDDSGLWIVVPRSTGRWIDKREAEMEAASRNYESGVTHASGELVATPTEAQDKMFLLKHLRHPECTCAKDTVGSLNAKERGKQLPTNNGELAESYRVSSYVYRAANKHNNRRGDSI